jgi:hypothetical protein
MTSRKTRLEQIDELIINEILATPDDEIIQEVGNAAIADGRAALKGAEAKIGQKRFEAARAQLEASKVAARVVPIESANAKAAKAKLLAAGPTLRGKLTLAARNAAGSDADDDDDEGLGDDLAELERDASDKSKA